jgi:hypothetical protein
MEVDTLPIAAETTPNETSYKKKGGVGFNGRGSFDFTRHDSIHNTITGGLQDSILGERSFALDE